jgi:hypothetical protein
MAYVLSDEEVGRQILDVFLKHKVCAGGTIRRKNSLKCETAIFNAD